jgi:secreted Zn-dependent insulinase-like peptidase
MLAAEPMNRYSHFLSDLLQKNMDTLRDQLDAIQKLTFTRFLEMKKAFLKRVRLVWLIEGHLLANQAMEMVEITEQALG